MLTTNYRQQVGKATDFLLNKQWLDEQYSVNNRSTRQIAILIGCGKKAVNSALKRHGIPINYKNNRTVESKRKNFTRQVPESAIGKIDSYDWMYDNYIINNLSKTELMGICGVANDSISNWLKKHGIRKDRDRLIECSARRYKEKNGFDIGSKEACHKRICGRRGVRLATTKAGLIWCHSSWEVLFAEFLDNDTQVRRFTKDSLCLEYEFDNKMRRYYPDFIVDLMNDFTVVIEIKSKKLATNNQTKSKIESLIKYCKQTMTFHAIVVGNTKNDIKALIAKWDWSTFKANQLICN